MYLPELTFRANDREFRIESMKIVVLDYPEQPQEEGMTIYAFRIWEGNFIVNSQELLDKTFDFYDTPEEAVDGGFVWLKKHLKNEPLKKEHLKKEHA